MSILLDLIILITLLCTTGHGSRKGLIMSAAKLCSMAVGFFGAWSAARLLKGPVARIFFFPWVEQVLTNSGNAVYNPIEQALRQALSMGESAWQPLADSLKAAGLPSFSITKGFGILLEKMTGTGQDILSASASIISERLAFVLLFVLTFFILQLIIFIIFHNINGLTSLPLMSGINHIGGGLCGLLTGAFLLLLVMWLAETFIPGISGPGGLLSDQTISASHLAPLLLRLTHVIMP